MKAPGAIELTWEDPDGPSSGFRIDRAADPYFTKDVRSFSVGAVRSCTDADLKPGATYYYRVRALRTAGESSVSNTAWPPPNYGPDGFTTIGLDLNGGTAVADKVLHLTDLNLNEARSAFYRQPVDVRAFHTKFRFRIGAGPQTADGFTFCIQGGGSTQVGQPAAGLGYQDIPKSVAVKFDLWNNDGEGPNSTGLFRNGDKPSNPGALDLTPSGIDLHSGRALRRRHRLQRRETDSASHRRGRREQEVHGGVRRGRAEDGRRQGVRRLHGRHRRRRGGAGRPVVDLGIDRAGGLSRAPPIDPSHDDLISRHSSPASGRRTLPPPPR